MGVDESAHSGALEGNGKTIAVLPTGLNNIYPRQNYDLSQKIIKVLKYSFKERKLITESAYIKAKEFDIQRIAAKYLLLYNTMMNSN